jgi:hypothetical protein
VPPSHGWSRLTRHREIGRGLPANYRKVPFSGAVEHLNEAATAPYFGQLSGESPETRTRWRMRQSDANCSPVNRQPVDTLAEVDKMAVDGVAVDDQAKLKRISISSLVK